MTPSNDLLVRIAWQYYIERLTQNEVAKRNRMSRSKVARLLIQAREEGIVDIQIRGFPTEAYALETQLRRTFDLEDAFIIPDQQGIDSTRRALGRSAADFLRSFLDSNAKVGLGMGRTLAEIPNFLIDLPNIGCNFIEMVGGASRTDVGYDTYNVSWRLADKCGGVAHHVNSPVVVSNERMRNALQSDPHISNVLALAASCDMAIVGLGEVSQDMTLMRLGYCDEACLNDLISIGAVGDILGHFVDIHGRELENPFSGRIVGLTLEQLKTIPRVVAVAGGVEKTEIVLGALRGGYLSHLITNQALAERILDQS